MTSNSLRGAGIQHIVSSALEARSHFVDVVTDTVRFYGPTDVNIGTGDDTLYAAAPTHRAHTQIAGRAGVPIQFYRRIAADYQELWSHTMAELWPVGPSLLRCRQEPGQLPVLRAALSDKYQVIDNVDVATTMLGAFVASGLGDNDVTIEGDLDSDDGLLRLRCHVPSIAVNARELVSSYRSPFDRRTGLELPMIFAGIEISNSETGGGAFTIQPRAVLQVCSNGMTRDIKSESFRRVHLGSRLESGIINWSHETRTKQLELIGSAAKDAITTFISPEYLRRIVDEASSAAGIEIVDITGAMTKLTKQAQLSDHEASSVLMMFMNSADTSVLGLAHAVTAAAQLVDASDRQSELEQSFWSIVADAPQYTGAH